MDNGDVSRILQLLAESKISAVEAEVLIAAVQGNGSVGAHAAKSGSGVGGQLITASDLASAGPAQLERYGCVYHLEQRNRLAKDTIVRYATQHAYLDAGITTTGAALKLFVPGAGIAATVASIAAARPVIYQPMAQELSTIYNVSRDQITNAFTNRAFSMQAFGDAGIATIDLAADWLSDIGVDLIHEAGASAVLSLVPIIGTAVSTVLDFVLARSLTWRLGTMISMYYQNGQAWIGDRAQTYARAKSATGGITLPSDALDDLLTGHGLKEVITRYNQRPLTDLNQVPENNKEVLTGQVQAVIQVIKMLMRFTQNRESILQQLMEQGVPKKLAQEALRWAFAT